jgi:hypothetical protein
MIHEIDELAGPRGRSQYVAEAVAQRLKRDRLRRAIEATAGAMVGKPGWMNPDEALAFANELRESWDKP